MIEPLVEAWDLNNRVNLFLLGQLSEEQLEIPLEKGKGLRAQFAHLVNVRRMWLKMYGRDLLDTEEKCDRFRATKEELAKNLTTTAAAIGKVIGRAASTEGRVKGLRLNAAGMLALMVAHEGYHRGQIELALRQAGQELPVETQIELWEWHRHR